jgi:F-type H+-transporting ATPase subunit b
MPQLDQLPIVFWSQLFWLTVVFGILFFAIGRGMLPKIEATIDERDARVAEDLAATERARDEANETEAAYRARIDESRAEALKVAAAAKAASARATEERMLAANEENATMVAEAEARIRKAADAALADIERVAADAARDMVQRLAGVSVGAAEAKQAVKAAMSHG